ncbi:hypothetical protein DNTS_016098 [Danionella cerebrum]|uniref:C2 domain-containing protein n=1 Tax=Danionella cerebrum TaxID=2873325 RepID=A0A553Q640_9TELE|nr:hypothetical protein DNTS_016098 [Danionella translucida]
MSLAEQSQQWLPTSARVTVLQARGLRAKGKNGTNDAYAVMQLGKDKFVTAVAEKSAAPVWKEQASFELPVCSGNGSLQVCVLHRALVGPDKTLGTADINLQELREDPCRSKPQWFKLMGKSGKADKERGEVLLDIKFMRNHMTASMFDLSQEKSRSRLSKLKDKLKGRKKDGFSDSASAIVASPAQILTDSEPEEEPETTSGARKKSKLKSLFVPKPGLHRNMSQSMSTLTTLSEKDSNISLRRSSGLNAESPEGKKKFWILKHKHSGSSDSKVSQETGSLGIIQSNVCINGSHIYTEKTEPRNSRPGSTVSLNSSGHGSMEELRRGNDRKTSMDSPEETLRRQGQEIKKHEQESKKEELIKEEELRKHEDEVREKNVERRQNEQKKQEELKRQEEDIKKQEEEVRILQLMEQEKLRKHEEEVREKEAEKRQNEEKKQKELKRLEEDIKKQEEEVRILQLMEQEKLRKHEEEVREKEAEKRQNEEKKQKELKRQEENIKKQEEEVRILQLMEQEKLRKHEEEVREKEAEKRQNEEKKQKELKRLEEDIKKQEEEVREKEAEKRQNEEKKQKELKRQEENIKKQEEEVRILQLMEQEKLRKHEEEVREKEAEKRQNEEKKPKELKRQEEDIKKQEEEVRILQLMEQEKLRKHEEEVRNTKMEMTKDEIMKQKELRKQEEEVRIRGNKRRKDELMKQEEDISKQQEEENKRFEDERRQTEQKRINIEGEHERMQMEIGMLENSEEKKRLESEEEIKTEREEERSLNEKWKLEKQEEGERLMTVEEEMRKEKDKQKIAKQEAEQRTTDEGEGMRIRNEEDLLKITNELEVDPKKEEKRKRKARKEEGGWGNLEVEERPKPESDDHQNDEEARKHEEERKCTKEKERIDFEKITFQGKISAAEEKRQKEKADEESMKLVKEERPAVKPRSARTNKKQSDGSPERNPVTSSTEPLSWDGIPTNPFEIIDDHPPRAVDRYRVSAVKPSSLLSQASVSNTKPFLEDSDSDTEHFVSPREKSEKKRQAPMPPKNKMPVKNPNSLPEEPVNNQASQGFGSDVDSCKLRQHKRLAPLPPNVSKDRQHVGSEHSHQFTSMLCTGILEKNQMKMNSALQETLVYLIDQSPREASNPFTDKLHHSSNFENQSVTEEHSCNTGHGEDLYNVECLNGDVEPKTENSQHDICASKKKNRAPLPPVKSEPNLNLNSTDEEVVSIQTSEPGDKHGLSQSKKNTSLAIKTTEEQMKTLKLEMVQGPGQRALPQAKVSPIEVGQNNRGEREKRGDHYIKPCRPHAVKPLNSSETPSETQGFSRTLPDVTDDVLRLSEGTFSQLTHAELISLIEKQKKQLSQKDSKIVELEQYIDDLLVRVMEENPSILMSLKKTA